MLAIGIILLIVGAVLLVIPHTGVQGAAPLASIGWLLVVIGLVLIVIAVVFVSADETHAAVRAWP